MRFIIAILFGYLFISISEKSHGQSSPQSTPSDATEKSLLEKFLKATEAKDTALSLYYEKEYLQYIKVSSKDTTHYYKAIGELAKKNSNAGRHKRSAELYVQCVARYKKIRGPHSMPYIVNLCNVIGEYSEIGQDTLAADYLNEMLQILESPAMKDSSVRDSVIYTFNNMAETFVPGNQLEIAKRLFNAVYDNLPPGYSEFITAILTDQKGMLDFLEQQELRPSYTRLVLSNMLRILRKYEVEMRKDDSRNFKNLYYACLLNYDISDYETGSDDLKVAVELAEFAKKEFGRMSEQYAGAANNIAVYHFNKGAFKEAEIYFTEAEKIRETAKNIRFEEYIRTLDNKATLYMYLKNRDKASFYHRKVLRIKEKTFGKHSVTYVRALTSYASDLFLLDSVKHCQQLLEESTIIYAGIDRKTTKDFNYENYVSNCSSIANLYVRLGNYDEAQLILEKTLTIIRNEVSHYKESAAMRSSLMHDLAYLFALRHLQQKSRKSPYYDRSYAMYTEALKLRREIYEPQDYLLSATLNNLGNLITSGPSPKDALSYFKEALEIRKVNARRTGFTVASVLRSLGQLYLLLGDLNTAAQYFEESIAKEDIIRPLDATTFSNLGYIYYELGKKNAAHKYFSEFAKKVINDIWNVDFLPENEKMTYLKSVTEHDDAFATFSLQYAGDFSDLAVLLYDYQVAIKSVWTESFSQLQKEIRQTKDDQLKKLFEEWKRSRQQQIQLADSEDAEQPATATGVIPDGTFANLEQQLLSRSRSFAGNLLRRSANFESTRSRLLPNECAVEFIKVQNILLKEPVYCAIIVKKSSAHPLVTMLAKASDIEGLYNKHRTQYLNDFLFINSLYDDPDLYKFIWQPLEKLIADENIIYVAPTGILNSISICSIKDPSGLPLDDTRKIRMVWSTRSITQTPLKIDKTIMTFTGFGGINYGKQATDPTSSTGTKKDPGKNWSYLPNTLKEVKDIAKIFSANGQLPVIYTDTSATRAQIAKLESAKLAGLNILHIATHGFFEPQLRGDIQTDSLNRADPKNVLIHSGLVLAKSHADKQNILTALQVSNLNLSSFALVVLSACESGLGGVNQFEGVDGLRRSFKMAGIPATMVSLWKVDDETTTSFMNNFYLKFIKNQNLTNSFEETRAELRMAKKSPYYWAAFELIQ
jgi:CHAT domain-containing protein